MGTRNVLGGIALISIAAVGCNANLGDGHAEPVDVPLSLQVRTTKPPTSDCKPKGCFIHVRVVLTNPSDQTVWALNCGISGQDASGRPLFGDGLPRGPLTLFTGPAGAEVDPGRSATAFATIGPVRPKRAAALRSLSGACDAYVWHGQVPI